MKIGNILNNERVQSLNVSKNAYYTPNNLKREDKVSTSQAEKVVFQQPYENASNYYNKDQFNCSQQPDSKPNCNCNNNRKSQNNMIDFKSLLPMLMGGKFNDMLKPIMSMLGGGGSAGSMDFAKIFELFKPKSKTEKKDKDEDVSSKFDDFIIIEDWNAK